MNVPRWRTNRRNSKGRHTYRPTTPTSTRSYRRISLYYYINRELINDAFIVVVIDGLLLFICFSRTFGARVVLGGSDGLDEMLLGRTLHLQMVYTMRAVPRAVRILQIHAFPADTRDNRYREIRARRSRNRVSVEPPPVYVRFYIIRKRYAR